MTTRMAGRIAIVGSGSIGLYYGIRLALGGADVRFLLRGDLAAVRDRGSLILRQDSEVAELRPAPVFGSTEEMGEVDLVVVSLKTTHNGGLRELLAPLLGPETAILTLQNGLGSDEALAALFGPERVLGGLAYIGCVRSGAGETTCHHSASLALGEFGRPPTARLRELAARFDAAGVRTRVVENLDSARWHKLVWNVPFNGLSIAAGGITTDRICADPLLLAEVRSLMAEVQAGARRLGHGISDDFLEGQVEVTPRLGAYRPSSLVDFQGGREVEVEPIWGEPLSRARAAGADLPRLSLLYSLLKAVTGRPAAPITPKALGNPC